METCEDPCGKPTAWNTFNAIQLKLTMPGKADYQLWRGIFDDKSNDIQIDVETSDGRRTSKGKILLFDSRVMAIRGPITEAGYESAALDAAVLQMRLVVRLLGETLPDGPVAVNGERRIHIKKEKTGIQFATAGAQGFIAPPWEVMGEIKRLAPDDFSFDLSLTAASAGHAAENTGGYVANFTGRLSKVASAKIDDGMLLKGWDVFALGPKIRKYGNETMIDYGATPAAGDYKMVSDIRNKIAADDYAGEPDASMNFTGFWKEDCEQAFGLQIMLYGKDGKYSVTFCGPGGCGTVGEDGKNTFITKDPDYDVVSESALKIRNAENRWDTYFRCTRDTHPVLKYK